MSTALRADIRWLTEVREEHRSWLAYSEIDLLHDFELQVMSGWSLSVHQRARVSGMVQNARDRREMAMSLSRSLERLSGLADGSRPRPRATTGKGQAH